MFPLLPVIYFILRNETKPKKNIILGVTLPYEARDHESVLALGKAFKRQLGIFALILAIVVIPVFLLKYSSVIITYYMIWFILVLIFLFVPYAKFHKKLKALKREHGWLNHAAGKSLVDIKVAAMPRQLLRVWWFLPPALLSLIPVIHTLSLPTYDAEFWVRLSVYGTFSLMVVLFYLFYRILFRQKGEIIDENTSLSVALTQVRRYNWRKFWMMNAWLTSIFNVCFWLLMDHTLALLLATAVYSIVVICVIMRVEIKRARSSKISQRRAARPYMPMRMSIGFSGCCTSIQMTVI